MGSNVDFLGRATGWCTELTDQENLGNSKRSSLSSESDSTDTPSSTPPSTPEDGSALFPFTDREKYLEDLLDVIKSSHCRTKKDVGFDFIFGKKETCPQFPFVELHVHLEGIFTAEELKEMAEKENLFYDNELGLFRRKEVSTKTSKSRIAATEVDIQKIKSKACVQLQPCIIKYDEDLRKTTTFDDTFKIRGSILDRVKLSTQLLLVMKKAKDHNIIYRELMYGIYDIPVPETFIKLADKLTFDKKQPLASDIDECIQELENKTLINCLSEEEQKKLQQKIESRFGYDDGFDKSDFFQQILHLNYVEAKALYVKKTLDIAEKEIKQAITIDDDEYGLDPNVSIFDARNVRSIKLIDEVMRHYSLGKFVAWLLSACTRIQKSIREQNECLREVGVTIDGPQDETARKNFLAQVSFLKKMRSLFPDVPFSMHALEYPDSTIPFQDELKHVISICEADENGKGRGRIGHGTRVSRIPEAGVQLARLQKSNIAIEFSATTAEYTTDTQIEKMPVKYFHDIGIPITFNTDDPGVFQDNVNIRTEIVRLIETYNFTYLDIKKAMKTAIDNSYMSNDSKTAKYEQLKKEFELFEKDITSKEKKETATALHLNSKRSRSSSPDR